AATASRAPEPYVRSASYIARPCRPGTQPALMTIVTRSNAYKGDLMRKVMIACSAALLALTFAGTAHADEWNKLTYLTFSGPVQLPGITLPAGTYRFELADPDSSRHIIRVSDKDGSKQYCMFLHISDHK